MRAILKLASTLAIAASLIHASRAQCGFAVVPATEAKWFRADGWATPGVAEAKRFAPVRFMHDGKSQTYDWPLGITASVGVYDKQTDIWFPDAIFTLDGTHKRMLARRFMLYQLVRWEMNGRVYAYTYDLGPYDVACTASVDLIDDRGDGKFRWMIPAGHTLMVPPGNHPQPPPLPEWLKTPSS